MKVSAVYLTYHPDHDLLKCSFMSALKNCHNIYVYDNNSPSAPVSWDENIKVIEGKENIGVSGLNAIISMAFKDGSDYIVILDQDSVLPPGYVTDALKRYKSLPGVYSPLVFDRIRPKINGISSSDNVRYRLSNSVIGSGLIISKEIFDSVGSFDESFFLDCVDIDYFFRLKAKEINVYTDTKSIMDHSIGDAFINFLGMKVSSHSPSRHYLYYRNSLRLIFRSYVPVVWKFKQVNKMVMQWIFYSLFSKNRMKNFMVFILAINDFMSEK
ncbi:glycosyltransferase, partial [Vibrio cholerae]|nr:glycosyltransferase [Vibrio cholerae]